LNKYDVVQKIENFAPLETQEKWDASGWIVDTQESEINKILFALTITDKVFEQAISQNCDMIISHHPLFSVPLEYKKINMYCAHTNLDKADGGTTDVLIQNLGYKTTKKEEFVKIIELEKTISINDLKIKLQTISSNLRYINNCNQTEIKTIGFCAGSGSEFIEEYNVDAFVTGDLKFHTALDVKKIVFDIGHFESEQFAPYLLKKITKIQNEGVIANETSPFIY